jgi:hypothetical protein
LQTNTPGGEHPHRIREFRLHIGPHKTATTHLQAALALMAPHLHTLGIDYVPMAVLQGKRIPDLRRRNWRTWLGGAALRQEFVAKLAPHRHGAPGSVACLAL